MIPQENKKSGLVYELIASDVPENWIPFVPVKINEHSIDQIRLQRGKMKRKINGQIVGGIEPQTKLLSPKDKNNQYRSLFLMEEEIPRTGIDLKTTYQRVRWYNGKIVLWCGRRKKNGQRGGNSGVTFDKFNKFVK